MFEPIIKPAPVIIKALPKIICTAANPPRKKTA
jgi:hypothetical protein